LESSALSRASESHPQSLACQEDTINSFSTPAEACFNLPDELNFYKDFEVGEDNRIQRLCFTDSKSIELAKSHSDIIMLDCTYQTNKYDLPLLNIIGALSLPKTTQIGLAFFSGEA
jgi:hypothetical protein